MQSEMTNFARPVFLLVRANLVFLLGSATNTRRAERVLLYYSADTLLACILKQVLSARTHFQFSTREHEEGIKVSLFWH